MKENNSLGNCGFPESMGDVMVVEEIRIQTDKPKNYKIIIFDDDVSPLELVLAVLVMVFSKSETEVARIINEAQTPPGSSSIIGVYPYDIAKTLLRNAKMVIADFPNPLGGLYPLKLEMEETQ